MVVRRQQRGRRKEREESEERKTKLYKQFSECMQCQIRTTANILLNMNIEHLWNVTRASTSHTLFSLRVQNAQNASV